MLLPQRRGGGPAAARRRPRSPVRRRRRPPRRRKMYLFYHSLLRRDRGRMARVVFFVAFWSKICAKGRFSRRPSNYLALLKYRVKNGVFRVFFSVFFRLSGKADGLSRRGGPFLPPGRLRTSGRGSGSPGRTKNCMKKRDVRAFTLTFRAPSCPT